MKRMPLTVENRWDILYLDYPEIYDEFAAVPKHPEPLQVLLDRFDFRDKVVADIGSGSGLSSFAFARVARRVIGVEIEDAMRQLAERERIVRGVKNIEFLKGDAKQIPLPDSFVDIVAGMTLPIYPVAGYRELIREAIRVTVNGGLIVVLSITPGWYGGELENIILDETNEPEQNRIFVEEFGFQYEGFETNQEYGSMEKIISTYGFIFGKNAIEYLKKTGKTNIKWMFRIHYQKVEK